MGSVLSSLQTIVMFLLILAVLVFFHELGHFGAAKLFKMRVEEFALGFGKRLVRFGYDGQTEYNLRAVPLGGFVRIAGMEIEDAMERKLTGSGEEGKAETTNMALMEQEAQEVDGADPDGFNNRPIYQRFLVILAGPVFSVLLAWLAFCLIGVTYGFPDPDRPPTTRITRVNERSPASRAGLKAGDTIVAIDGVPLTDGEKMIAAINGSPGKPLRLTIQGKFEADRRAVTVTPRAETIDGKVKGLIGIVPDRPTKRVGLAESFRSGGIIMVNYVRALGGIFQSAQQVKENLGGPIAIFRETHTAVGMGGSTPLQLLAMLSLSIGIFNLLPIPVLDGGHLTLLTLEAVRGRKLTAEQTQRVLATGLAILAFLFVYVMFNDITRLFGRG